MPKASSNTTTAKLPWWLDQGDEECPHCGQLYFAEVEARCVECDGPLCLHCRVRHSQGHFVCPECVEREPHG